MKIKNLSVKNFKSIKDQEVEFKDFNVFIGKNASGKSNILELLEFLRDIINEGLDDAIQLRGGTKYFKNNRIGDSKDFHLRVDIEIPQDDRRGLHRIQSEDQDYSAKQAKEAKYELRIEFEDNEYQVKKEVLTTIRDAWKTNGEELNKDGKMVELEKKVLVESGEFNEELIIDGEPRKIPEERVHYSHRMARQDITQKESLLYQPRRDIPLHTHSLGFLSELAKFDINPQNIKGGTTIKGKNDLEEDGRNLPLVLKKILESEEKKEKFSNLIQDLLPFMKDWQIETYRDKSISLEVLEEFKDENKDYLPSNLISDGTVNIIAIVIILYFENRPLVVLEEPERNIHPALVSRIVNMMEDASSDKQIFVTTHNPQIIKYAELENIMMVRRDEKGFTEVNNASENDEVQNFLNEGLGLDEIYSKNLLN